VWQARPANRLHNQYSGIEPVLQKRFLRG
jgi:hypothetical protein